MSVTKKIDTANDNRIIYLAGGCFWGVEAYIQRIYGVIETEVGYANGITTHPTYEEVCTDTTGFAETVKVIYNPTHISLYRLLHYYFRIIDPTSINRQGNDIGSQYRTGIYYIDQKDVDTITSMCTHISSLYKDPVVVEVAPLENFYKAEDYHQSYLAANPHGYCHIPQTIMNEPLIIKDEYTCPDIPTLKDTLPNWSYYVTQENGTEPPFSSEYYQNMSPGIYVDITTGEPLFSSNDKFNSHCGWPSFSKSISNDVVIYSRDTSHNMVRTEVKSRVGNAHLGHVFDDGPSELGGKRYCINGAALRFIPLEKLEEEGYGYLLPLFTSKE